MSFLTHLPPVIIGAAFVLAAFFWIAAAVVEGRRKR